MLEPVLTSGARAEGICLGCAALPPEAHAFLPKTGWLVFRWERTRIWGYQPNDRGSVEVSLFEHGRDELERWIDDDDDPPDVHRLSFSVDWLLPEWGAKALAIDGRAHRNLLDIIVRGSDVESTPNHLLTVV